MIILLDYFFDENNEDSLINIFSKDIYDNFIENFQSKQKYEKVYDGTQIFSEKKDLSNNDIINRVIEDNYDNNIQFNKDIYKNEFESKDSKKKESSFSISNNTALQNDKGKKTLTKIESSLRMKKKFIFFFCFLYKRIK